MSERIVKIHTFDDGRQRFQCYTNKWRITDTMFNGGKLELTNVYQPEIKINSISSWKVTVEKIEKNNYVHDNPQ